MTRTERIYYLLTSLYRVAWAALGPTYALFLLDRGLDLLQLNVVLAVYLITTCVLEIPTGAIADMFGRKASFVLSCLVRAIAFGLYYVSDSFPEFLVAEVIDAVGTTLATGAFEAWAVDGVRAEGDERPVDRLFARGQMLGQGMGMVGGLFAAYLASRDLALPWLVGAGGFLVCGAAAALLMRETHVRRRAPDGSHYSLAATVREGVALVRGTAPMRWLCLLTAVSAFATLPAFQMWQPRLTDLSGQGPWLMGWVWLFLNLTAIVGSALIPRTVAVLGRPRALALALLWRAATLGVAGAAGGFPVAFAGFLLQEIGFGFSEPVLQAWMNEHATAAQRATILSVRSMSFTLGGGLGLLALGWLARETDIATAWLVSAAIYALAAPWFLALARVDTAYAMAVPPDPDAA